MSTDCPARIRSHLLPVHNDPIGTKSIRIARRSPYANDNVAASVFVSGQSAGGAA